MKNYQLNYLISPDFPEEELKNFSKKINNFIQEEAGILKKIAGPYKRMLAYPIKGRIDRPQGAPAPTEAFLVTLSFHLEPKKLESLERKLKSEEQLLRYIILTKKSREQDPIKEALAKELTVSQKTTEVDKRITRQPRAEKVALKEIDKKIEEILKE